MHFEVVLYASLIHDPDLDAMQLARKLDGLPLALATAGAFLRQTSMTFKKYFDFWEQSWAKLQTDSPALIAYEDRTLFTTWQISFDRIKRRNSLSANVLRLWAYFDDQDLWFELLNQSDDEAPEWLQHLVKDEITFHSSVRVLCEYGLAEANTRNDYRVESKGYSVHACVHSWMLAVLNMEQDNNLARTALRCVASHMPKRESSNWFLIQRRLLNHANRCSKYQKSHIGNDFDFVLAFNYIATLYREQGKWVEAEEMYLKALGGEAGKQKSLVVLASDLSMLETLENLGGLYQIQGKLVLAELIYMLALRGFEHTLGADHTLSLGTINDLGIVYAKQGRVAKAEEMYKRALTGIEKARGADHLSTLDIVHNLGNLYVHQNKTAEAEDMYTRALRGKEMALGTEHTITLGTVNNLAALYTKQGKIARAEEMCKRALTGTEKTLGADHPSTLEIVYNLGFMYRSQGKMVEADQCYRRAKAGYNRMSPLQRSLVDELGRSLSPTVDRVMALHSTESIPNRQCWRIVASCELDKNRRQAKREPRRLWLHKLKSWF